jgi:hypothetical protein
LKSCGVVAADELSGRRTRRKTRCHEASNILARTQPGVLTYVKNLRDFDRSSRLLRSVTHLIWRKADA